MKLRLVQDTSEFKIGGAELLIRMVYTPMHKAASNGNLEQVKQLVRVYSRVPFPGYP